MNNVSVRGDTCLRAEGKHRSAFFKHGEKSLRVVQYIALQCVDPESRRTETAASAALSGVVQSGLSELLMRVIR